MSALEFAGSATLFANMVAEAFRDSNGAINEIVGERGVDAEGAKLFFDLVDAHDFIFFSIFLGVLMHLRDMGFQDGEEGVKEVFPTRLDIHSAHGVVLEEVGELGLEVEEFLIHG